MLVVVGAEGRGRVVLKVGPFKTLHTFLGEQEEKKRKEFQLLRKSGFFPKDYWLTDFQHIDFLGFYNFIHFKATFWKETSLF